MGATIDDTRTTIASNVSPPLLKLGETQITRPVTSDTTVAFSSSLTAPVNLTVSD